MRTCLASKFVHSSLLCLTLLFVGTARSTAHDGPDPLANWQFVPQAIKNDALMARLGPQASLVGDPQCVADEHGHSMLFDGRRTECVVTDDISSIKSLLPQKAMTLAAWVSIDQPEEYGGIISCVQDNGDAEQGWVLGYNKQVFTFGLATKGADDGNGRMTYLPGKTKYEPGKFYHVVGVYDGSVMQLYVNGQLDAESKEQSGEILYPEKTAFVLGAYKDRNEHYLMKGRLRDIAIYGLAAKGEWVAHQFEHDQQLTSLVFEPKPGDLRFVVEPYLQFGTQNGMTVAWQASDNCQAAVYWGEDNRLANKITSSKTGLFGEVRIEDLKPNTQYFYLVRLEKGEQRTESELLTFQTAVPAGNPVSFAVISDTQDNLPVAKQLSELAWAQRPHFVLHSGDLVGRGKLDSDWIEEFFPAMMPLISRVPLFPVLGNHEDDARNYYNYMSLPDPEYYYSFAYGDAEFFMIDSNRNVDPGSEQYVWLEQKLAQSKAIWKFVCHHHPPYSSDENDYGDLWKTNQSTRGDLRIRQLSPLYEKYGVDIVWTGHIHSYERTWPIRDNQAVEVGGTIYMITGGGGGSLETPGPYRPFFQNNVRHGHHYMMVHINGRTLEMKAFSLDDKLFDYTKITK